MERKDITGKISLVLGLGCAVLYVCFFGFMFSLNSPGNIGLGFITLYFLFFAWFLPFIGLMAGLESLFLGVESKKRVLGIIGTILSFGCLAYHLWIFWLVNNVYN